jgi:hypothetical protein
MTFSGVTDSYEEKMLRVNRPKIENKCIYWFWRGSSIVEINAEKRKILNFTTPEESSGEQHRMYYRLVALGWGSSINNPHEQQFREKWPNWVMGAKSLCKCVRAYVHTMQSAYERWQGGSSAVTFPVAQ